MTTISNPALQLAHKLALAPLPNPRAIAYNQAGYVKPSESGASFIFCPFRGGSPEKYFGTKAGAIRHMNAAIQSATLQ